MRRNIKILLLFVGLVCSSVLPAAVYDTLFYDGFEGDVESQWFSLLGTDGVTFEKKSEAKRMGDYGFHVAFSNATQKANFTTPKNLSFAAGRVYHLSFWYKAVVPSTTSATNIKVFSSAGDKIGHINFSDLTSTEWTRYSLEYSSESDVTGGYVLFSFRADGNGAGTFYFDDFTVEKEVLEESFWTDLKMKKVTSDSSVVWQQFGPGMSGNCKSAFWHPTDPNTLFIGPNMGNSYVSYDKGKTYQTTLDPDESDFRRGPRGPVEYTCVDFSRQDEDFGLCTDERNSGVFVTYNKGRTWQLIANETFGGIYVDAVAVDPKDDNIWYAGAGRLRNLGSNLYPHSQPKGILADDKSLNKIWKSVDKGQSWTLINKGLKEETGVETLFVDPKNSDIVYASTSTGFYKSTDGGDLWVAKNVGMDYDMLRSLTKHYNASTDVLTMYVMSNPMWKADGNTITDDKGGIYKSTDRGENWVKLPGAQFDMTQFQSNSSIRKSFYHCAAYIFDMTDVAFEAAYPTLPSKITMRWNTLEVDPNNPNIIFANNEYSNSSRNNFIPGQVWRTTDGGQSWVVALRNGKAWNSGSADYRFWGNIGNPMGTNIELRYLEEWLNRDMYDRKGCNFVKFNCDGTVLHTQMAKISLFSYDKGNSWQDIDDEFTTATSGNIVGGGNSNVPGHGFYQHPDIKNKVFCMSGENQLCYTTNDGDLVRDGAQAVKNVRLSHNEASLSWYAVHPTNTQIHYGLFFRQLDKGKLFRSTDGGVTWAEYGTAIPYWDITGHSGDQSVHQLHLTIDPHQTDNMYFVVPKNTLNLAWVGNSVTAWGFHRSTDGGRTWSEANVGLASSLDATKVEVDPKLAGHLYVTIQGSNGGLFKSVDYGATFEEVSSTMDISGDQGINDIHFDRAGNAYITAGSKNGGMNDGGVWVSKDGMQTWVRLFDYPWTNRIETAYYNDELILVSTLPSNAIGGRNAGTYLSRDGGEHWIKVNLGNGQSDRINDIAIDNHVPGKYYVSTYGSGWYTAQDSEDIEMDVQAITTASDQLTVYPNPVDQVINFSQDIEQMMIYSAQGQLLSTITSSSSRQFDVSHLAAQQVYFYTAFANGKRMQGKFVKQ